MNIVHNKPSIGTEELLAAQRVLNSTWLAQGVEVREFENEFCSYLGLPAGHAVAVSSGTAALYLALHFLTEEKSNVALPSYACTALSNSIRMHNSNPTYVDNDINSPNINITELNRSKCSVVIVPHTYGFPVDLDRIQIPTVIEDCCQSLGSYYKGKHTGLNSQVGVFSFYATKLITSGGQGGMVVSTNSSFIEQVKDYRDFDMKLDRKLRFNFQMTDIQAAIGRVQLRKLGSFLRRRKEIFQTYLEAGLELEKVSIDCEQSNYRVIYKTNEPERIIRKLKDSGVKSIIPLEEKELPVLTYNSLNYCRSTVSLPVYPYLTDQQVSYIVNILK